VKEAEDARKAVYERVGIVWILGLCPGDCVVSLVCGDLLYSRLPVTRERPQTLAHRRVIASIHRAADYRFLFH